MKILYFYQYFSTPKGSWGTRVYEFASEWVKKGHEVTVVSSIYSKSDLRSDKFIEEQEYNGIKVKVININIDNKQSILRRIWTFILYSIVSCYYAVSIKCDLVISSSGPITVGIPGLIAKFIRNRPFVFEVRDLWPDGAIELGVIKNNVIKNIAYWFEKKCYDNASLIVGLSPGIKKWIEDKYFHHNVIDVTNGANIDLFSRKRGALPWQDTLGKYFVYTGNIGEVNNCMWLLRTAQLLEEKKSEINIVLVGDGQLKAELQEEVLKKGLKNLILKDLMPKEELIGVIQGSIASLIPLKGIKLLGTSSPNKFFESLAAGVPVIQNTDGWMDEFVKAHRVGFTVKADSEYELAELLQKLVEMEGTTAYSDLRNRCLSTAVEYFDKQILSDKMLEALKKLL
ncbi:MAG: glycosyltransferase family 4 protein [Cyclobacteriaceae bacterium]